MTPLADEFAELAEKATQGDLRTAYIGNGDYDVVDAENEAIATVSGDWANLAPDEEVPVRIERVKANADLIAFCFNHRTEIAAAFRAAEEKDNG